MEWFNKLFRRPPKKQKYASTLDGFLPIFTQFGTNIYASDVVQQALKCIVDEMKKLNPTHVRYKGNDPVPVNSTVQDVLSNPNQLMTTSEFLEKTIWLLLMNYNAFIIPTYYTWIDDKTGVERRYYEALYPINPTQVDFIEDAAGRLFVTFWFWNGYKTTIPYDDVIHIKYNYSVNQYMGGNMMGQPDHEALLGTLELNNTLLQGIAKAMKASYAVNGVVKYNTFDGRRKNRSST
jgi:Phage portal protein.